MPSLRGTKLGRIAHRRQSLVALPTGDRAIQPLVAEGDRAMGIDLRARRVREAICFFEGLVAFGDRAHKKANLRRWRWPGPFGTILRNRPFAALPAFSGFGGQATNTCLARRTRQRRAMRVCIIAHRALKGHSPSAACGQGGEWPEANPGFA
jgi:hypothetical protein